MELKDYTEEQLKEELKRMAVMQANLLIEEIRKKGE